MKIVNVLICAIAIAVSPALAGPLHDASRDGDRNRILELVAAGADVSELDEAGESPLLIAALAGQADAVALLLEKGADIGSRNKGGLTALHAAAYGGHLAVVELLVSKGASIDDDRNFYHMSSLHAASEEGHADVVAFLIARKADIEAKERNGYTPLTQAGWRSHWDAADLLIKAGAACQPASLVGDWLFAECTKHKQQLGPAAK
jgi:ankyrin repeat protein